MVLQHNYVLTSEFFINLGYWVTVRVNWDGKSHKYQLSNI